MKARVCRGVVRSIGIGAAIVGVAGLGNLAEATITTPACYPISGQKLCCNGNPSQTNVPNYGWDTCPSNYVSYSQSTMMGAFLPGAGITYSFVGGSCDAGWKDPQTGNPVYGTIYAFTCTPPTALTPKKQITAAPAVQPAAPQPPSPQATCSTVYYNQPGGQAANNQPSGLGVNAPAPSQCCEQGAAIPQGLQYSFQQCSLDSQNTQQGNVYSPNGILGSSSQTQSCSTQFSTSSTYFNSDMTKECCPSAPPITAFQWKQVSPTESCTIGTGSNNVQGTVWSSSTSVAAAPVAPPTTTPAAASTTTPAPIAQSGTSPKIGYEDKSLSSTTVDAELGNSDAGAMTNNTFSIPVAGPSGTPPQTATLGQDGLLYGPSAPGATCSSSSVQSCNLLTANVSVPGNGGENTSYNVAFSCNQSAGTCQAVTVDPTTGLPQPTSPAPLAVQQAVFGSSDTGANGTNFADGTFKIDPTQNSTAVASTDGWSGPGATKALASPGPCGSASQVGTIAGGNNWGHDCTEATSIVQDAQITQKLGQLGGGLVTQAAGQSAVNNATTQGTQSAVYSGAGNTMKVSGDMELGVGGMSVAMGVLQYMKSRAPGGDAKTLTADSSTVMKAEQQANSLSLDGGKTYIVNGKVSTRAQAVQYELQKMGASQQIQNMALNSNAQAATAAQSEEDTASSNAKWGGITSMAMGAIQMFTGAEQIKAGNALDNISKAMTAPTVPIGADPFNPNGSAPGAGQSITGSGQTAAATAGAPNPVPSGDLSGLVGQPTGTLPTNALVGSGPTPDPFTPATPTPPDGGGGDANLSPLALNNAPPQVDPQAKMAPADRVAYDGGSAAYAGGGSKGAGGASNGPDLSGLLAAFLPKNQEQGGPGNSILNYGAGGRSPASMGPDSLLDQGANLFERIHETYLEKHKGGFVGGS